MMDELYSEIMMDGYGYDPYDRLMMMCRVSGDDDGRLLQKLMNAYASYLYVDRCQLYGYT
jgi:hypothetical protein